MSLLVTLVKRDFGAAYSPSASADLKAGISAPFTDSREIFLHGLLDENPNRRWGTCASIPVLVTAVARRLGYPVFLATTRNHIFAKWEDGSIQFNIEASNPMGMVVHSDDYYRHLNDPPTPEEMKSSFFVRSLSASEAFAQFLHLRVDCLRDNGRYEETLLWSARALQFAPDEPNFPLLAHLWLEHAIKHRLRRAHPEIRIPSIDDAETFYCQVGDLLAVEERSLHLTIVAHYKEAIGELDQARESYDNACRHNFYGENEQRDLQRFLRKYNLPPRAGPLLPPKQSGVRRHFRFNCSPEKEAEMLKFGADHFERRGDILKAHHALKDLYMFDPSNSEAFQRARRLELHPAFASQLKQELKNIGINRQNVSRQS